MSTIYKNIFLFIQFSILFSPDAVGQSSAELLPNDTTYMLTYDHGGQILWGLEHFRAKLNNAKEWLDRYPEFKIGLENEAHVYDYFAEKDPALLNQIKDMLKKYQGRFGIGSCSYGQSLCTFINEESNIRQIKFALDAERKHFNYRPPVYFMSEHAMHSQMPQILKSFGFEGAIMRTHYMMYGYNPTFNVAIGNWKGIDGSKIPTIPTYTGEGAEFGKTTVDNWMLTRYPGNNALSPLEYRHQFNSIRPLLASRADDSDLRKEEFVKEVRTLSKFRWILLDELLSKYPLPVTDLTTGPNDFVVRMPWGYCGNYIWNESRKAEVQVLTAERLAAMELLAGGQNHESRLKTSWQNLLVGQHHDVQIVGLISSAKKYLSASQEDSGQLVETGLKFFASHMKGEGVSQVTVFNPLSWSQKRWISVKIDGTEKGQAKSFIVKSQDSQFPVRFVNLNYYSDKSILDGTLLFEANLPPLCVTAFSIIPQKETVKENKPLNIKVDRNALTISTPLLELQLSSSGGIKSLTNKVSKHTYSSADHPVAYFAGTINGVECRSEGKWIIQKTDSASSSISATEYGMIGEIPFRFEIRLFEGSSIVECKVNFDFNGQKIGLLSEDRRDSKSPFVHDQKLRFTFFPDLDLSNATGVRDLPFAIAETSNNNVEGNYWTALTDGKNGIAFFNKGTMGSIRELNGGFSIPLAYAMHYIWGTRMLNESLSYEFALFPFSGDWKGADLHRQAIAYNFPLPSIQTTPGNGNLSNPYSVFEGEFNDPVLSALYTEEGKLLIRLYEYQGKKCGLSLKLKEKPITLNEISMDGNLLKTSSGSTAFEPWQIKTFEVLSATH